MEKTKLTLRIEKPIITSGKKEATIARQNIRLTDGMKVRLEPLKRNNFV